MVGQYTNSTCREKLAVPSDKIDSKGTLNENPRNVCSHSTDVNDIESSRGEKKSAQQFKDAESSSDMNFNSIEATAANEAEKVDVSAGHINKSQLPVECGSNTVQAIASSPRHASSKKERGGTEGGHLKEMPSQGKRGGDSCLKENKGLDCLKEKRMDACDVNPDTATVISQSQPCCPLPEDSKDQEHFDKSNKQKTELQHKKEEAPCKKKFEGLVDSKPGRKRERGDVTESGKAKKEKVEPGLMYLLANLTTEMMKKGGVQTKEEAEQLVNQDILNNHSCFKVCVQYSEAWAECQSPH